MNHQWLKRRPRWAFPFTVLSQPDIVRLAAGEDYRYTLTEPGLDVWLPPLLAKFTGQFALSEILDGISPSRRTSLQAIVERLYGERVLVDGPPENAHRGQSYQIRVEGQGELCDLLLAESVNHGDQSGGPLQIYCQDRLDYAEAQRVGNECRRNGTPWLWCSTGAQQRGYVGPLFLSSAGPCFTCLLRHFRRLSPAPEIYDALALHAQAGGALKAASFPRAGLMIMHGLMLAKLALATLEAAPPALYRLHVLEVETMEVTSHRVFADPECPACHEGLA